MITNMTYLHYDHCYRTDQPTISGEYTRKGSLIKEVLLSGIAPDHVTKLLFFGSIGQYCIPLPLARISHQDHGSRRRIRIRKRRSGAKSIAIAMV